MKTQHIAALILKLESHNGKHVGFFHTGGSPTVRGWWERKDGSEGGELVIDATEAAVLDYDGCYALPQYVLDELKELGVSEF